MYHAHWRYFDLEPDDSEKYLKSSVFDFWPISEYECKNRAFIVNEVLSE